MRKLSEYQLFRRRGRLLVLLMLLLVGCSVEEPPRPVADDDILRARAFVEAEAGSLSAKLQTRAVNKNHPALDAFDLDWSRARIHKDKEQKLTVTEIPTTLMKSYLYAVLVEQFGQTISQTIQEPHTRVLVYDYHGRDKRMEILLATLLPDEGWGGDIESLNPDPLGSNFSGTSVYTTSDGTPLWGYRYDNGESLYEFYFDEDSCTEKVTDMSINLGVGRPLMTRSTWVMVSDGYWLIDMNDDGFFEHVILNDPVVCIGYRPKGSGVNTGYLLDNLVPPVIPINVGGSATTPGPKPGNGPGNPETMDENGFTVLVAANPADGGNVSGGGVFFPTRQTYSGSPQYPSTTVSAAAKSGYLFAGWTGAAATMTNPYTFTVNASMVFIANFRPCYTDGKANPLPAMELAPPGGWNVAGATYGNTRTYSNGRPKMHNGIDLAGTVGTPVYAQFDGVISGSPAHVGGQPNRINDNYPSGYSGDKNDGGNRIYIDSNVGGKTVKNGYMHLMAGTPFGINPRTDQPWKPGDKITAGEIIGYIGITGNSNPNVPLTYTFRRWWATLGQIPPPI